MPFWQRAGRVFIIVLVERWTHVTYIRNVAPGGPWGSFELPLARGMGGMHGPGRPRCSERRGHKLQPALPGPVGSYWAGKRGTCQMVTILGPIPWVALVFFIASLFRLVFPLS
jgi:hypothetical protein